MLIGGELPRDIVLNIFPEMHRLDVGPKLHKLRKVLDGGGGIKGKLPNPLIIMECNRNIPILPLAN
jgi:hypothetical protein